MRRGIFGAAALAAVALLLTIVGAAGAGSYTTGFESFTTGTVNAQDGWHSALGQPTPSIPALPDGYDQEVVDNDTYGGQTGGTGFGDLSLRVSNAVSEKTGEFEFQTYSAPTADAAGEGQGNTVFDGTFEFISTSADYQPGLQVSVSPDNGHGGRMSFVRMTDTPAGIDIDFFETDASGNFVGHDVGIYSRNEVHTIRFLITFVPGEANDALQLFVDGVDIGARDGLCFTTWESFYRSVPQAVPVTDSFEFRADNSAGNDDCDLNGAQLVNGATCIVPGLDGGGYLFDNVTTETRASDGANTACGTATLNVTKFYDANANGTKDGTESDITGWKVQVENGSTQVGTTPFTASGLAPGDYTASEFTPNEPNWFPTTDTSVGPIALEAGDDESVSFGNVCTGDGGGLTIGFWGNKNGLALVDDDDLAALRGLYLRNADGSDFNPTTKAQLKAWLSKASATNMAYMLSAQLAAMKLNVLNGMVLGSALVYAPGVTGANAAGFITVDALMAEADASLFADGLTKSGDPNRSYQQTLMNALAQANQDNSTSYVQAGPCDFSFPGPICNAGTGNTDALYNAIPTDVGDCAPRSLGFEATGTNEFGDEVTLDPETGTIGSLTVDFQSYACNVSGEWQLGQSDPCVSTPGATFPVDLTANIYEASAGGLPGALLGTVTLNDYAMPYRPSADPTNCPAGGNGTTIEDGSQWFNPAFGTCQYSVSELVTFDFATPIDPPTGTVIWTVAFNTETAGYTPTGVDGPYDSLNVGAETYDNQPYAGEDASDTTVFWSYSGNGDVLKAETGWDANRPLGQITAP